jgi:DNA polymerase I-like protein with 3'-5' exonuclease and polymerase domains
VRLITLDFETFYSTSFGLRGMTTEEYIRDERFEVIGVAYKIDDGPSEWVANHNDEVRKKLEQLPWDDALQIGHNNKFDAAILSWRYGIHPVMLGCTMSMSRAVDPQEGSHSLANIAKRYKLGEKGTEVVDAKGKRLGDFSKDDLDAYGEYCRLDVDLCFKMFKQFAPHFQALSGQEMSVISDTLKMYTEPTLDLDSGLLAVKQQRAEDDAMALVDKARTDVTTLRSTKKLAELFVSLGVDVPMKTSPTTGLEIPAFAKGDMGFMRLLDHEDERVSNLATARLAISSNINKTRMARLHAVATRESSSANPSFVHKKLPVPLNYFGAHTGRWSGADKTNLQNLPSRGGDSVIKQSIRAPEGFKLVDCDSSQIEARVLAYCAGEDDLIATFARGEDVYKPMAATIFSKLRERTVLPEDITPEERVLGKVAILAAGYGMGATRFQHQLSSSGWPDADLDFAQTVVDTYRDTYPKIRQFWYDANNCLKAFIRKEKPAFLRRKLEAFEPTAKGFKLATGLMLSYPNLRCDEDGDMYYDGARGGDIKIYGGKVTENLCQAIARNIVAGQLVSLSEKFREREWEDRVALTVHDSLLCVVDESHLDESVELIENEMSSTPAWAAGLPLACESKVSETYGG